jgi:hypothetical protein
MRPVYGRGEMMAIRVLTAVLFAMTTVQSFSQAGKLDGTWKLNLAKSFLGAEHPVTDYQLTKKIEVKHRTASIIDTSVNATMANIPLPDSKNSLAFAVDGKEHDAQVSVGFPGVPSMPAKISATWEGCSLAVEIRGVGPGAALIGTTKQRLFLSEDGSQLIVLIERRATYFDSEQKLIFDKQW